MVLHNIFFKCLVEHMSVNRRELSTQPWHEPVLRVMEEETVLWILTVWVQKIQDSFPHCGIIVWLSSGLSCSTAGAYMGHRMSVLVALGGWYAGWRYISSWWDVNERWWFFWQIVQLTYDRIINDRAIRTEAFYQSIVSTPRFIHVHMESSLPSFTQPRLLIWKGGVLLVAVRPGFR